MVKIIPPSLVPTEGRNTGHEYSVAPQNPLFNKELASNGFSRAQFVIAMYKKNQSKVTNFREKVKSRTFVLELNIINIFQPYFLIYSLSFRPTFSLELPQYSKRNRRRLLQNLSPGCTQISIYWTFILVLVLKRQYELINKYHYCIQSTYFHNNAH